MFTAAVVTVSDKGYKGEREDISGAVVTKELEKGGFAVRSRTVVPDEREMIENALKTLADEGVNLVVTTGGTGFAPRDVTPEATLSVAEKVVPGVAEAIRAQSMKYTDRAMLGRGVCVIRKSTVILNLPGSPKACAESLSAVIGPLGHGVNILCGKDGECAR